MGVPKFFRCISERYPCLCEVVKEFQIPDFDNLYLDMNGIIHSCSHPNDFNPHFSITEENIFASIFHYIEVLFNMIKPRKLFFLAVDGVAPRAKINQQRARRFRSAKEAEMREKEALEKTGQPLPKERFDSNCITPGTVFMDRLHSQLKYFISSKISTDSLWQRCKVILSGHQTPGEGEHKIMDYIRYLKAQPDFDENTKHVLYGLDADLITLGLCTHEPHFSLLREKVSFTKKANKKIVSPDETEFYLLHLSMLREYLDLEFQELKETLPFQYNLENIIDDWVLMGFLVGNDFIPNLPDLHINKGAFPALHKAYKEVLPTLDGYLNENGYLNLPRFQAYMERMSKHDLEAFEDIYANLAFLEEKTGRSCTSSKKANGETGKKSELEELIRATEEALDLTDEESLEDELDDNETFMWEFCQHKKHYYTNKMDYSNVTPEVLKSQAEGYIRAIQWNLHYYYQGCRSWSWYYPHHYAPYISDITNFKDLKLDFEMGKPFLPFEQLLAVLPAASKELLPKVYWDLMTSPNSPIKDFYPENFETDLNGKQQDWEAIVLIPFIDEKRLLDAMKDCNEKLTAEERNRNRHGPMHVFTYTEKNLGLFKSVGYFPSIPANHASMIDVAREDIAVDEVDLKRRWRLEKSAEVFYRGSPKLKYIPFKAALKLSKVKVFEFPSRSESMILTIGKQTRPELSVLAANLLGKTVYVNWPFLLESKVVAVSSVQSRHYLTEENGMAAEEFNEQKKVEWLGACEDVVRLYAGRLGIELGPIQTMVHVKTLNGTKCITGPSGTIVVEKIWSNVITPCPAQIVVENLKVEDDQVRSRANVRDAFPVNSTVFMLGQPHFGSKGRIIDNEEFQTNSRLKVELEIVADPVIHESMLQSDVKVQYLPCRVAAIKAGLSSRVFGRITGSVLVSMTLDDGPGDSGSKINIGLNLKYHKKNEEIPGYTKKDNENWLYSPKAIDVVASYVEKFSRVVEYLSTNQTTNVFFVRDIFPGTEGVSEMKEMVDWIKAQEYNQVERIKCGTKTLEPDVIAKIEEIVSGSGNKAISKRQIQVKPTLLYKSDLVFGNFPPVPSAKHHLLDRVVSIRSSYTVPTGLRGFIVAIYPAPLPDDFMYEVLFDTPFLGGLKSNSSSEKCFKMARASFLNITDAQRQGQRSAPAPPGPAPVTIVPRPGCSDPKTSAFAQWSQTPPRPVPSQSNNEEFKKIWTNLQTAKPQEDALKKLLKIDKKNEEEIVDPVKSFFEKVTRNASAGAMVPPPPNPPAPVVVNPPPKNKYFLQLFSYYQKRGLGQPRFKYLNVGGKVLAQVSFSDGKVFTGFPCDDKESACESASLQALSAFGEIPGHNPQRDTKPFNVLTPMTANHIGVAPPEPFPKGQLPLLPNPPSQWVGAFAKKPNTRPPQQCTNKVKQVAGERPRVQNPSATGSGSKKLNASALEFVPLQVITGKRSYGKIATIQPPKQTTEAPKKTEQPIKTIKNNAGSTSSGKRKRKPKIAANLNLDPNLY